MARKASPHLEWESTVAFGETYRNVPARSKGAARTHWPRCNPFLPSQLHQYFPGCILQIQQGAQGQEALSEE